MTEDGLKALLTLSGGDMRKILNTLQSTWMSHKKVSEDNVYSCVGHPLRSDISNIVNWLLNEDDFSRCYKRIIFFLFSFTFLFFIKCYLILFFVFTIFTEIKDLKDSKGLALSDILTEIHMFVHRSMFSIIGVTI